VRVRCLGVDEANGTDPATPEWEVREYWSNRSSMVGTLVVRCPSSTRPATTTLKRNWDRWSNCGEAADPPEKVEKGLSKRQKTDHGRRWRQR
jgi:hypothetical protein